LDLIDFAEIFDSAYIAPRRDPKLGHYSMVAGILMLLFIGFNRYLSFCIYSVGRKNLLSHKTCKNFLHGMYCENKKLSGREQSGHTMAVGER